MSGKIPCGILGIFFSAFSHHTFKPTLQILLNVFANKSECVQEQELYCNRMATRNLFNIFKLHMNEIQSINKLLGLNGS